MGTGVPQLRSFHDTGGLRRAVFHNVTEAFREKFPLVGKHVSLHLQDVRIWDKKYSLADQKNALMENRDLTVPLVGKVELRDKEGKVLDAKTTTLAHVPYLTPRGTAISKGVEYVLAHQFRLKPGVYTRRKDNGELESHFNVAPGTGTTFRLGMDPESGIFRFNVGSSHRKLYPLLHSGGVDDATLEKMWGREILAANKASSDPRDINNIYQSLFRTKNPAGMSAEEKAKLILGRIEEAKLDPDVTRRTLGQPYEKVSKLAIVDATRKLLQVNRGEVDSDDRDSLAYRTILGPEDFLAEKVRKDAGNMQRKLLWRIEGAPQKTLARLSPGYFTPQLKSLLSGDARAAPTEEINPLDLYDQQHRVISLGEGGIPTVRAVPDDARNVHTSQIGVIDPVRGPESDKIGVDLKVAWNTFKGKDNRLYAPFRNVRTGRTEFLSPETTTKSVIAFPGELAQESKKRFSAIRRGTLADVERNEIDYEVPTGAEMMAASSNLVPFMGSVSGTRLLMAGKAFAQALPFAEGEAPLVRTKVPGSPGESFEGLLGKTVGAHTSKIAGMVTKVTADYIEVTGADNKPVRHDRYKMFPFNRATFIDSAPVVKVGDKVSEGDILAKTNFTDARGNLAIVRNLRAAYIPYRGYSTEDGIVISESASKKLTTDQLYASDLDYAPGLIVDRNKFVSYFPTKWVKEQTEKLDTSGVIRPGARVSPGDPLIVALSQKSVSTTDASLGRLHKALRTPYTDASVTWDQDTEGEVIDVAKTSKGVKINVRTLTPAKLADKVTGRFGNKGVISAVLPDDQMPRDESGRPLDILLNPLGIPSRINPGQVLESLLGKVATKTGAPILVEPLSPQDNYKFTEDLMKQHGVKDTETIFDPITNKHIPGVLTGVGSFLRTSKTAKSGFSAREIGPSYTSDLIPGKGGKEGAKRIGNLDANALISHNVREVLRSAFSITGHRNDAYWKAVRLGQPLPSPEPSFVWEKFKASLLAGGINVSKRGDSERVLPLTDKDTVALSKGAIRNARMLRRNDLKPESGGLFDEGITGGPRGDRWAHVDMSQPIPNPVMEEPVRRILGLTEERLRQVLAHKESLAGRTGGQAILNELSKLDLDAEIAKHKDLIKSGKKSFRDNSVKVLSYLESLKKNNLGLDALMISKVPVIPPKFRPITFLGEKTSAISPANQLYADLLSTVQATKALSKDLPAAELGAEFLGEYDATKAIMGLGDPVSAKAQRTSTPGFIRQIIGDIPKTGMFQRKLLSRPQDLTGRAVVVPDPALSMDEVGMPEDMAWKLYKPFVMRRLVQKGMSAVQADQDIESRTEQAKRELMAEMEHRPAIINRAPTLHKFNILATKPKLRQGKSLAVPTLIAAGFNLDHDGDQMNVFIPASEEARQEAHKRLLPSKNLFATKGNYPMHVPVQDAVLGLYKMTAPSGSSSSVRKFATKADALAAYKRNEIRISDPIDIEDMST